MLKNRNVFSRKITILLRMFFSPFMSRKILFIWVFLGISLLFNGCQSSNSLSTKRENKETEIFTQNMLLGVHAKMIAGKQGKVTILKSEKLSPAELTSLQKSAVILGTTPMGDSIVKTFNYTGLYVSTPELPSRALTYHLTDIEHQIDLIRDALCEVNSDYCWYYYDNAGNYVHLLDEMNKRLLNRINEYRKMPFITIWGDFENFLLNFWLTDHRLKHYETTKSFLSDRGSKDFVQKNHIQHIFVYAPIEDWEIRNIEKKYLVTVYRIAHLEEDTSGWGYLRYVEKIMNDFVRAFDTYD